MPKVQHPAFKDIVIDVSRDALEAHLAAGWVEVKPALVAERGPELVTLPKGSRVIKK